MSELQSRLGNLTDAEKKQDMLDMELEEAEAKVKSLTDAKAVLETKLAAEIVEKTRANEARDNKDAQITELESRLLTETQRVAEFKVAIPTRNQSSSSSNTQRFLLRSDLRRLTPAKWKQRAFAH